MAEVEGPTSEPQSGRLRKCRLHRTAALASLAVIWIALIVAVDPRGEFPLNDDWSYSQTMQRLVDTGTLRFTGWQSVPLIVQLAWGRLFCAPLGFSFLALRLSTVALGFGGVVLTYFLFLEVTDKSWTAWFAAIVVACNPVYLAMSCTFMSDVPFFTFALLSILPLMRYLTTGSKWYLLAGTMAAIVATLTRQSGLAIPAGFALAWLFSRGFTRRTILVAAAPLAASALALVAYEQWLESAHLLPHLYRGPQGHLTGILLAGPKAIAAHALRYGPATALYLGLFTLPITLAGLSARCRLSRSHWLRLTAVVAAMVAASALAGHVGWKTLMPTLGNVFVDFGIGPRTLRDVYILGLPNAPVAPGWLLLTITLLGWCGAALIALPLVTWRGHTQSDRPSVSPRTATVVFLLAVSVLYALPMFIAGGFDRYLLLLLPTVGALWHATLRGQGASRVRRASGIAAVLVAAYAAFAVAGTHDYLSWNRARWVALDELVNSHHVPPSSIDGGFEFNGWHLYDPAYESKPDKSWWWVSDDEYVLAFGPMPGYQVVRSYSYERLLPPGHGLISVLRRGGPDAPQRVPID